MSKIKNVKDWIGFILLFLLFTIGPYFFKKPVL